MQTYKVTEGITIEALGPSETETPVVYIKFDDYPEPVSIPVFGNEIKALCAALVEAAVWLADQVKGGDHDNVHDR